MYIKLVVLYSKLGKNHSQVPNFEDPWMTNPIQKFEYEKLKDYLKAGEFKAKLELELGPIFQNFTGKPIDFI